MTSDRFLVWVGVVIAVVMITITTIALNYVPDPTPDYARGLSPTPPGFVNTYYFEPGYVVMV